ncbi:MAG: class I SAM-dependent methyltransferase [Candidatus Kuenenia stuttgartiensis]|nr:class I SAM-dependent methyltransferase [Candidatus Kuenenia stuttgartiensis]MCL4727280.1 methyltransferase domain-containing protein [Candidatus Kuenenia stuttgartiensis]
MSVSYFVKRQLCPVCESEEYRRIYSCQFTKSPIKEYLESFYLPQGRIEFEYLGDSEFILNECNYCGLIYQEEIPNGFLMEKIYEEWINPAKSYEAQQNTITDDYLSYTQEVLTLITYFRTIPSQLKFLDFGMGWGIWCQIAKAMGCESYGTELSETRIEYVKSNVIKVINWKELPNHVFHFINTEQVFGHIADPLDTLRYLKKTMVPGGLLKISVPNGTDIKRKLKILDWTAPKGSRNSLNPVAPLEHINCFTHRSIITMADIAGFEQVKIPLSIQYCYAIHGKTFKQVLKNVLKPIYRNILNNGTYIFLRQKVNS